MQKTSTPSIAQATETPKSGIRTPISHATIGLINPKTPTNVGAVMRAAGCFRVDGVFYTGKRYERAAQFATDTKAVSQKIPITAVDDILQACPDNAKIVCIELVENGVSLPDFQHPDKAFYVFGPEDGSISQQVVDCADAVVYIPTVGCLNLAATVNVVLYDRLAKSTAIIANDALVRESRDTNNNLRVKNS